MLKWNKSNAFVRVKKSGTAKKAVAKNVLNFNHSKANDLRADLNNTANISQGLGSAQLISHQPEPNNATEANLTRIHKVLPLIPIKNKGFPRL